MNVGLETKVCKVLFNNAGKYEHHLMLLNYYLTRVMKRLLEIYCKQWTVIPYKTLTNTEKLC